MHLNSIHSRPLVSSMERSGVGDILCLTGSTSSDGGADGGAGGSHKVLAIGTDSKFKLMAGSSKARAPNLSHSLPI